MLMRLNELRTADLRRCAPPSEGLPLSELDAGPASVLRRDFASTVAFRSVLTGIVPKAAREAIIADLRWVFVYKINTRKNYGKGLWCVKRD